MFQPTVKWHKDANGSAVDPFLDAVAGASLQAGDEGGIVEDAVEKLARSHERRTFLLRKRHWAAEG